MPSKPKPEFVVETLGLLQIVGPVTARGMFGGYGLFLEGLMFGIIVKSTLYLKSDAQTEPQFIDEGLEKFQYLRQGKPCYLNYYQAPEACFEDTDALRYWANMAIKTAMDAAPKN